MVTPWLVSTSTSSVTIYRTTCGELCRTTCGELCRTMIVQEEQTVTYTLKEVVDQMNQRFDKIDQKIESQVAELRASISKLDDKINSNFKWLLGIVFGSFIATMGMLVTMFIFIYSLKPLDDVKNGVKTATAAGVESKPLVTEKRFNK